MAEKADATLLNEVRAKMGEKTKYSFEQLLKEQESFTYHFKGDSMEPFLNQKTDLVVICRPVAPLKPYDVILYKRDSGQYVLHRILKCRAKDYLISGDNRWFLESGITDRHVLGILTGVIRDGKMISVEELTDPKYLFWNCKLFWLRAVKLRIKFLFRRLKNGKRVIDHGRT